MTFISLQVFILRDFRKMLIIGLIIGIVLLLSSLIALIISRQTQSLTAKNIVVLTFIAFCLLFGLAFLLFVSWVFFGC